MNERMNEYKDIFSLINKQTPSYIYIQMLKLLLFIFIYFFFFFANISMIKTGYVTRHFI